MKVGILLGAMMLSTAEAARDNVSRLVQKVMDPERLQRAICRAVLEGLAIAALIPTIAGVTWYVTTSDIISFENKTPTPTQQQKQLEPEEISANEKCDANRNEKAAQILVKAGMVHETESGVKLDSQLKVRPGQKEALINALNKALAVTTPSLG